MTCPGGRLSGERFKDSISMIAPSLLSLPSFLFLFLNLDLRPLSNNRRNSAHCLDYLTLAFLAALIAATEHAPPFLRPISGGGAGSEEELFRYRYPFIGSAAQRVPASALPLLALGFPSLVIVAHATLAGRLGNLFNNSPAAPSRLELHAALLGLFASVFTAGAATNLLKLGVGRPRPNFAKRCWPDSEPRFDADDVPVCAENAISPLEARKSWPSGHSSVSSSGLCYLTFWAAGKLRVFSPELAGHPSRLFAASLPLCLAAFVAVSRVSDFYHHASDVASGFCLGTFLAYCHFRQCFRCFTSSRAGESHAAGMMLSGGGEGGEGGVEGGSGDGGGGGTGGGATAASASSGESAV